MIIKKIIKINNIYLNKRLDKILSILLPNYSRTYIKKIILNNKVKSNFKIINNPKKKIIKKTLIEIFLNKNIKKIKIQNIKLNILYEDKYILIINKPSNFIVHPGYKNYNNTLINSLLYYNIYLIFINRIGLVHRLDKDTSGLIIIAKTFLTKKLFLNMFKNHKIIKQYKTIVEGKININGIINIPILRNKYNRIKMNINKNGKNAITYFKVLKKIKNYTELKIQIKSGRTHQIRVHMLYIKHPIIGDKKYNLNKKSKKNFLNKINKQILHAYLIDFYHPIYGFNIKCYLKNTFDIIKLINLLNK
ncbi:23S rRNA pseudouridine(1911/1915/1917) synthase RluD [Enterobacterales bacterium endosymbiont of Anomoneura mori]|uniref:RluA family pseudouridine synthase n=1 Tax=Enterobacterales bacterium endosymbiont of Anomoneura mori TaxID=3132096 RepID=UPI00399D0957